MTKSILITGGMGFIASNFVNYLFDHYPDYKIVVIDSLTYAGNIDSIPDSVKGHSRFEFHYGNICNSGLVDELVSKVDVVVHFAAESHVSRSIYDNKIFYETDVLGTQSVTNAVLKNSDRIERYIHISTSEVYGSAVEVPMTEEHPLNPLTPYASAKVGADRLVYSYYKTYGIPAVIVRPFNAYGCRQHLEKAIPRFITSAILNEPITIHGTGEGTRDWNYVDDLCKAFDIILHIDLKKVKGEVINLGTGKDYSINEIAYKILSKMNKPSSLITYIEDRPGQVIKHCSSTKKAKELLGWQSETDIDVGLDKTIRWYIDHSDWWKRQLWLRNVSIINKDKKVIY